MRWFASYKSFLKFPYTSGLFWKYWVLSSYKAACQFRVLVWKVENIKNTDSKTNIMARNIFSLTHTNLESHHQQKWFGIDLTALLSPVKREINVVQIFLIILPFYTIFPPSWGKQQWRSVTLHIRADSAPGHLRRAPLLWDTAWRIASAAVGTRVIFIKRVLRQ